MDGARSPGGEKMSNGLCGRCAWFHGSTDLRSLSPHDVPHFVERAPTGHDDGRHHERAEKPAD